MFDFRKIVKCGELYIIGKRQIETGCGWQGTLAEAIQEEYCSPESSWRALAGRKGWIYKCPKCNKTVYEDWLVVS